MKFLFSFSLLICCATLVFGQAEQPDYSIKDSQATFKKLMKKAQNSRANKNYNNALGFYEAAILAKPENSQALYELATLYDTMKAFVTADTLYQRVEASEEENRYPLLAFQHGKVLQTLGEYEEAIKRYRQFIQPSSNQGNAATYMDEANQNIKFCERAITLKSEGHSMYSEVKNIGNPVNDPSKLTSEFAPYVIDGNLYFSRFQQENSLTSKQQTYKLNAYKYTPPATNVTLAIGAEGQNAHVATSSDGQYLYEVGCDDAVVGFKNQNCTIYRRDKTNTGNWSKRIALPPSINAKGYTNSQPTIGKHTNGKEYLYFSSDRPNGKGDKNIDIWRSEITKTAGGNLSYSEPINLEGINTAANEVSPFYHDKCGILYYSSDDDRKPSLGGFDIYQAIWSESSNSWDLSLNLGYPINSSFDDVDFFRNKTGEKAYFASQRITEEELNDEVKGCCLDIFEATLEMPIDLNIVAMCGREVVPDATYSYTGMMENGTGIVTDEVMALKINEEYKFTISKSGYSSDGFDLSTTEVCDPTLYSNTVYLQKYENLQIKVKGNVQDGIALDSVQIQLIEERQTPNIKELVRETAYFDLNLDSENAKRYTLITNRKDYTGDTTYLVLPSAQEICDTTIEITLEPKLPAIIANPDSVSIYFHNDIPKRIRPLLPLSRQGEVRDSYDDNYRDYIALKQEYRDNFSNYYEPLRNSGASGISGQILDYFTNVDRLEQFFTDDVEAGFEKLQGYAKSLKEYIPKMSSDKFVSIRIRGSASPTASDQYNKYLSERRINSVRNYLMNYDNVLRDALQTGDLVIDPLPLGEVRIDDLSDDPLKNKFAENRMEGVFAIYDPISARTRKVTIEAINIESRGNMSSN